jgi:hypothetical protein
MKINKMAATAGVVLFLSLAAAGAVNEPELKEGLWSVHNQTISNPGNKKTEGSYTLCRDHAFDRSGRAMAKAVTGCTKTEEHLEGGKYSSATHCVAAGITIESRGITTFQGDTSTNTVSHSSYAPAMAGMNESTTSMDEKYIGACPAGMLPGDRTMTNGQVIHLGKR